MECFRIRFFVRDLPITPILQYSITPFPHSQKRDAAIDIDCLTGNEITQWGREKQHRADDILRHLDALQRAISDGRLAKTEHLFGRVFFG